MEFSMSVCWLSSKLAQGTESVQWIWNVPPQPLVCSKDAFSLPTSAQELRASVQLPRANGTDVHLLSVLISISSSPQLLSTQELTVHSSPKWASSASPLVVVNRRMYKIEWNFTYQVNTWWRKQAFIREGYRWVKSGQWREFYCLPKAIDFGSY